MAVLKEFIIENFRCFREEQRIPIRPITLLVGENSTGKSSVLGGYRVLHNMMITRPSQLNFNESPFLMGSFQDIVSRFSGGSASNFRLGANLEYRDAHGTKCCDAVSYFSEEDARPVPTKTCLSFDSKHSISIIRKGDKVKIAGPSQSVNATTWDQKFENSRDFLSAVRDTSFSYRYGKKEDRQQFNNLIKSAFPDEQSGQEFSSFMHILRKAMFIEDDVFAVAPVRANPQRTYDYSIEEPKPNGEYIPSLMVHMFRQDPNNWKDLQSRLTQFGKESGMFSQIKIKEFGKDLRDPFQIQVKAHKIIANWINVGYGVSQVLPILAEVIAAKRPKRFLLQQPEVHLHPRGQAALSSFFAEEAKKHSFIIETQSDFIVDRVSISIRRGILRPQDVALLFFNRTKDGVSIEQVELNDEGDPVNVPKGFREFFMEESKRLLGFID